MGAANADVDQGGGRYPDLGRIYLEVVQLVMLYGLEMWVMKPGIGRVLGKFHHRVACRLTGGGALSREGQSVGIPLSGGRNVRCGTAGGEDLRLLPLEHGRTVYCY